MAAARPATSTRWVIGIMVVALLASVLVVVGLIEITGQSPSSSADTSESAGPSASESGSLSGSASADPPSPTPSTAGSRSGATVPTTTPVVLAGSGLDLPAAWTGTADMTITVLGRCAETGGTSLYTLPAQFALQVSPAAPTTAPTSGASASPHATGSGVPEPTTPAATAVPPVPAGPVSMTLGITPTGVPGLSIYSTSSSRDGSIRRTWVVDTQADPSNPDRTAIAATLVDDQPVGGALPPNLLVDSETDLLPCETGSGVRLPRPLAKGATVTGWVSATQASLDVSATTTDGERSVQAHLELTRTPGS